VNTQANNVYISHDVKWGVGRKGGVRQLGKGGWGALLTHILVPALPTCSHNPAVLIVIWNIWRHNQSQFLQCTYINLMINDIVEAYCSEKSMMIKFNDFDYMVNHGTVWKCLIFKYMFRSTICVFYEGTETQFTLKCNIASTQFSLYIPSWSFLLEHCLLDKKHAWKCLLLKHKKYYVF